MMLHNFSPLFVCIATRKEKKSEKTTCTCEMLKEHWNSNKTRLLPATISQVRYAMYFLSIARALMYEWWTTFRRETAQMWKMSEGVRARRTSQDSQPNTYRGKALHLRGVFSGICTTHKPSASRADAHRTKAPQVFVLPEGIRQLQWSEAAR